MSLPDLRVPFGEAISEKLLLGPRFAELSSPQRVALKIMYGAQLDGSRADRRGFTELDYWSASQGCAVYDELGFLLSVTQIPYIPKEYREAWGVWGVRAGKTDCLAATAVAYEAVCGGHEAYTRPGRPLVAFQIAQDLRMARYSLHSIKITLESMPLIGKSWIKNVTADRIELKNGVTIATTPPTVKSIRGYDSPIAVLDEVGVWYQDTDSANPDAEIYRQVSSRQAQFRFPKIIGISSPWNKGGLLYQRYAAGTEGSALSCAGCRAAGPAARPVSCVACRALRQPHQGRVILHGTTAGLDNPLIQRQWLEAERNKDPRAFERECLAKFQDSLSGFLSTALLDHATDKGTIERPAQPLNLYVAALDPAFRRDAFGFAICHRDGDTGKIVFDLIRQWRPPAGGTLDPKTILGEIAPLCRDYRCGSAYTDQYQFESLRQLALDLGLTLEPVRFTATKKSSIYGNLQQLLNQKRLRLLDHPESLQELRSLERRLTAGGIVQVTAPEGQHDDLATVVALAAHAAVWLSPDEVTPDEKPLTLQEQCHETVRRHRALDREAQEAWD